MRRLVVLMVLVVLVSVGCGKDDPTTPVTTTGACCVPAGACLVTTEANCQAPNIWHAEWTNCQPNNCLAPPVTGACCTPARSCTVTTEAACVSPSVWHGAETSCAPNPCQTPPTGSCCAVVGTCTVTTQAACAGTSTWALAGVCTPNPCSTQPPLTGMVWIPPGNVRLGQVGIAEPVNDFYVAGFYIDIYEVSNAKYKAFIDVGGYITEAYWNPVGWAWRVANSITLPDGWNNATYHGGGIAGMGEFPVAGVSWFEADAYCRWAGKRLPTEAEWEKAAKGGCEVHGDPGQCDAYDTPTYPWGQGATGAQANYFHSGNPYENNGWTTPVGYFDGSNHGGYQTMNSPSPYGLYDVVGNVWEWCSTRDWAYPYDPNDGRENPPVSTHEWGRVLRGSSVNDDSDHLRCATRDTNSPDLRFYAGGFRCVRTGSTPPPTGSCCAVAGTCTVTTQASCTGTNTWTLALFCTPNPCTPTPTGACCAPLGTCTVTTQASCTGTNTWTLAGVCTPNPCSTQPPLTGMVWIPPGNVRLGQTGIADPVNDFYVEGFYIDRYEVSNARYKAFIDAGGYTTEAYWNPVGWAWRVANSISLPANWNSNTYHGGGIAGNEQFPANGVSWFEADAYCRWAGKRLPSEAEWEKAAKGGCETHGDPGTCDASDTPSYPWGEGISGPQANYSGSGDPYEGNGYTTPVGFYDGSNHGGYQTINSPSPYGLYDVAGNVYEWCSTRDRNYPYNPNDGREDPPVSYSECCRVLRGGCWFGLDYHLQSAAHTYSDFPYIRSNSYGDGIIGFRCVRTGS